MSDRELLDRPALARRLNVSVEVLYRRLKTMLLHEKFPQPVFGNGRGARWDPRAIDAWLDAKLPNAANSNTPEPGDTTQPDALDALLDARAAKLGRG